MGRLRDRAQLPLFKEPGIHRFILPCYGLLHRTSAGRSRSYWDFDFDTGSTEPRDSSASAIAVCGILEMAKYLDQEKADRYLTAADRMLKALVDHCANTDITKSNGLLLHGTYARDSKENTCTNRGVDECNTWGDYFYMEALTRLSKDWKLYW